MQRCLSTDEIKPCQSRIDVFRVIVSTNRVLSATTVRKVVIESLYERHRDATYTEIAHEASRMLGVQITRRQVLYALNGTK